MVPILISADELKKELKGYHPSRAEEFHSQSAKLADKLFAQELKKTEIEEVFLMCGGTATGKTEFLSEYLDRFDGIIVDGTLPTTKGAKIKIGKIQKAKKRPIICAIMPDDLKRAFNAFLGRDRQFKDEHFYRTHSGSRKTLLWIAKNYKDIEIRIYESSYSKSKDMTFKQLAFANKKQLIEFLENSQYTEDEIFQEINL